MVEFEELIAPGEMLLTGYVQRARPGSRRYCDAPGLENAAAGLYRIRPGEPGGAMAGGNTCLFQTALPGFREGVGESALEAHQFRPVDSGVTVGDAFAIHAARAVYDIGCADKHFLRITPAQAASSAIWA
jgi:hypothetical protein